MSNFKRMFSLVSCFVISIVCGIFALLATINYSEIADIEKGELGRYISDWNICIIIFVVIVFSLATTTLLLHISFSKDGGVDKAFHLVVFVLNVLVTITTVIIFAVLLYKKSDYMYRIITGDIQTEVFADAIDLVNGILDMMYNDCFILLLISCVANVCCSLISLGRYNNVNKEDSEEKVLPVKSGDGTENDIVKSEIEKLKKELELQDLKKEYESLYKKLHKNDDDKEKKEDIN